jgi:hypothetical protein
LMRHTVRQEITHTFSLQICSRNNKANDVALVWQHLQETIFQKS